MSRGLGDVYKRQSHPWMNLFEFLLVTLSNIISLNVRDGKIKLCFTDIGAEELMLDQVDEVLEEAKQLGRNQSVIASVNQEGI